MKKRFFLISALFFIALAFTVIAQQNVCCCDKYSLSWSFDTPEACLQKDGVPIDIEGDCSEVCETAEITPPARAECGAPGYHPAPGELTITPVKGKAQLKLLWSAVCPADGYAVYKCSDAQCTSKELLDVINGALTSYTDSVGLLWKTQYTYSVVARYGTKESFEATASGNTGDIECSNQITTGKFCISKYYYFNFQDYLVAKGYAGNTFEVNSFENNVIDAFRLKLNKAYSCDANNNLIESKSCNDGTICSVRNNEAFCIAKSDCATGGDILGLGFTVNSCESQNGAPRYCFFDRSSTVTDECYSCDQRLSCYDYKSQGACERDNCATGGCEWTPVSGLEDFGIGVCTNKQFSNCHLCGNKGTVILNPFFEAPNLKSYNEIFDQCTQEKSDALESAGSPCFYSEDPGGRGTATGCENVGCSTYKKSTDCASPAGGIKRDSSKNL